MWHWGTAPSVPSAEELVWLFCLGFCILFCLGGWETPPWFFCHSSYKWLQFPGKMFKLIAHLSWQHAKQWRVVLRWCLIFWSRSPLVKVHLIDYDQNPFCVNLILWWRKAKSISQHFIISEPNSKRVWYLIFRAEGKLGWDFSSQWNLHSTP